MEIRQALKNWLLATPGVTALVGQRIYPNKLPQGSIYPQITFFKVSDPKVRQLSGPSGLSYPRLQIDCWAKSLDAAKDVAEAVRISNGGISTVSRLDGYSGSMSGVTVQNVSFEDQRDAYFPDQDDSDRGTHQVTQDVILWWNEG